MTVVKPVAEWEQLGVRLPGGAVLPDDVPDASLVSGATRHFLVYHNYDALLAYNCSHSYAVSVGLLASQLTSPAGPVASSKPKPGKRATRTPAKPRRKRSIERRMRAA